MNLFGEQRREINKLTSENDFLYRLNSKLTINSSFSVMKNKGRCSKYSQQKEYRIDGTQEKLFVKRR